MITGRSGRGHGTVVGGALQGIDHLVRDVEHGRFETPNRETTIPNAGGADHDCSKGAIRNLNRTLALELAPLKINVKTWLPAWC